MGKKISNQIMLITYPDCFGKNLKDLHCIINHYFSGAVYGLHVLPFFPSTADRGFAPVTYREVDTRFGTWEDIMALSEDYYLMYDYMINHISKYSSIYRLQYPCYNMVFILVGRTFLFSFSAFLVTLYI